MLSVIQSQLHVVYSTRQNKLLTVSLLMLVVEERCGMGCILQLPQQLLRKCSLLSAFRVNKLFAVCCVSLHNFCYQFACTVYTFFTFCFIVAKALTFLFFIYLFIFCILFGGIYLINSTDFHIFSSHYFFFLISQTSTSIPGVVILQNVKTKILFYS